jgi:hypothetical protein
MRKEEKREDEWKIECLFIPTGFDGREEENGNSGGWSR